MLFPQLYGKCQGKTHKDGARPALFHISLYLCCSVIIYVVLSTVCAAWGGVVVKALHY